jgi:cytochrome oxidase Cu insertion factor (SCO1/SenC/PrrC family)
MILRALATVVLVALLGLNLAMPGSSISHRGSENKVRNDVTSRLLVGQKLPELELVDFNGGSITRDDLLGHRVLLTFERSVDW